MHYIKSAATSDVILVKARALLHVRWCSWLPHTQLGSQASRIGTVPSRKQNGSSNTSKYQLGLEACQAVAHVSLKLPRHRSTMLFDSKDSHSRLYSALSAIQWIGFVLLCMRPFMGQTNDRRCHILDYLELFAPSNLMQCTLLRAFQKFAEIRGEHLK
jgi:hypothetical protein